MPIFFLARTPIDRGIGPMPAGHVRGRRRSAALGVAILLAGALGDAHARRQPPAADLDVQISGPVTAAVNVPEIYTVTVTNQGGDRSDTIQARVDFALTNTSPQVYILGAVLPMDTRCSVVGNRLTCSLAALRKGWSTTFQFRYTTPVSTRSLPITASVTSSTPDPVTGNNTASILPNLGYPARPIAAGSATVRLCSGTALSAFAECSYFPSSITSFPLVFRSDRTVDLGVAGYTGQWSQNPATTSLSMALYQDQGQGPVRVLDFNGWAIHGANCFHGLSTFPQDPSRVSPYEVCLP